MSRVRWIHASFVMMVAVIIQTAQLDEVVLFRDARIDLPLVLVVGLGFVARADDAAVLAFIVGLMVDLFQFGPFGLHALVYCLAAWALALARVRMLQAGASFRTVQGAGAVAIVTALTWTAGRIFGQDPPTGNEWFVRLALASLLGAVLVHPARRVAQWMFTDIGATSNTDGARP